jgi:regulator of nonsense transcripts 1
MYVFVRAPAENTVVLLARDTPVNHPTIKDLNLDMSQWQPIIEVGESKRQG